MVNGVSEALSVANAYTLTKNKKEKRFDFDQIIKRKPTTQKELDSLKIVLENHPFYEGFLHVDSFSTTLIAITLDTNVLDSKYRDGLFEKIAEDP